MTLKNIHALILLALLTLLSCQDDNGGAGDPCDNNFDQEALYTNLADNLIIPIYTDLQIKIINLRDRTQAFVDAPDVDGLTALRESWKAAYLTWEQAAPYEFGPAEQVFLRNSLNNFPLNVAQVDQNIQSGAWDFDNPSSFDKGFPALDYLLFGIGNDDAAIVDKYINGNLAANYRQYLSLAVADMTVRVVQTLEGWTSGGYRSTFVQNTGTAAGSSLSLIVNNLNEHYEEIKRDRIGIPSGVVTLGFTNPDKVEAFFSGISAELALEAVRGSQRFYLGEDLSGNNRTGLDDFLREINAEKNGRLLDEVIQEQYEAAVQAVAALEDPLSEAVDQNTAAVEEAYNELTKQVVNLKTDMPAVLCVAITYVDNPSDSD